MFGKITDKLLHQLHDAFDCLGCQDIRTPDFETFRLIALNNIVRISNVKHCGTRINAYRFCKQNWKKVQKIFEQRMEEWLAIPFYGFDTSIRFRSDEEIRSATLITNGLTTDDRQIELLHWDNEFKVKSFDARGNSYYFEDTVMKMPTSEMMNIYDDQRRKLCTMELALPWFMVELKDNVSDFTVKNIQNQYLAIVRKEDEEKLVGDESTDEAYYVGKILWNPIDNKAEYGLSRLIILQNVLESEKNFLIQMATAPILILHAMVAVKNTIGNSQTEFTYNSLKNLSENSKE